MDALRLSAALNIALTHARAIWFRSKEHDLVPSHLAHGSVVIFFVLSGYVIAYTTGIKKRGVADYAAARFSRLYSVFFPALIFTLIVSLLLFYINPGLLQEYTRDKTAIRYLTSLFFCNEIWFLSAAPLINGVIWSLSYEFWFYTIFGCWLYRFHYKKGWLFLAAAVLIAGPKILLMLPLWLLGVAAYALPKPSLTTLLRISLIALSIASSVALMLDMPQLPYNMNSSRLYWASSFFSDFIEGLVIAIAFWLLPLSAKPVVNENTRIKIFRKIADLTFPIYVFHYPCLVLCLSLLNHNDSHLYMWIGLIITLMVCFFIGMYTEKWHQALKIFFSRLFNQTSSKVFLLLKKSSPL